MRLLFRKLHRQATSSFGIRLSHWAGKGGLERIKTTGNMLGLAHYYLVWPFNHKLRRDAAQVLGVSAAEARRILRHGWKLNDRAAFEILAQGNPEFDTQPLIDSTIVENAESLDRVVASGKGAILLSMHMGNTVLAAAKLVRMGYPVRVVFREPQRLKPGYMEVCLDRIGLRPMGMDRADPSKVALRMLKTLSNGEMVFVLMDQGTKSGGVETTFLNKKVRMPTGIVRLVQQTGAEVIPINTIDDEPVMKFRVEDPVRLDSDREIAVKQLSRQMEQHLLKYPHLWGWHHRRWKRYDLIDQP